MEVLKEKEYYRQKIIEMVEKVEDKKFLQQIWTILNRYMQKGGD